MLDDGAHREVCTRGATSICVSWCPTQQSKSGFGGGLPLYEKKFQVQATINRPGSNVHGKSSRFLLVNIFLTLFFDREYEYSVDFLSGAFTTLLSY